MANEENVNIVQEALVKYVDDAFKDAENLPSLFERFCICSTLLHSKFDEKVEELLRQVRPGFKIVSEEHISKDMWVDVVKKFKGCDVDFDTFCSLGTSGLLSGLSIADVYENFMENGIVKDIDLEKISEVSVGIDEAIRLVSETISRDVEIKAGESLNTSVFSEDYTVLDDGTITSKKEVADGVTVLTAYLSKEMREKLGENAPPVSVSGIFNKEALFQKLMKSRKHMNEAVRVISDIITTEDFVVYVSGIRMLVGFCPESSFTYSLLTGHLFFPPELKHADPQRPDLAVDQTSAAIISAMSQMTHFAGLTLKTFDMLVEDRTNVLEIISFSGSLIKDIASLEEGLVRNLVDKLSSIAISKLNEYDECYKCIPDNTNDKDDKEIKNIMDVTSKVIRLDAEIRAFINFFAGLDLKHNGISKFLSAVLAMPSISERNFFLSLDAMKKLNCLSKSDVFVFMDMIGTKSDDMKNTLKTISGVIELPREKDIEKDTYDGIILLCESYFRTFGALDRPYSKEDLTKITEFAKNSMMKKEQRKPMRISWFDTDVKIDHGNHRLIELAIDMFFDTKCFRFSTCCSLIAVMSGMGSSLLSLTKTFLFTAIIEDNESGENDFDLVTIALGVRDAILKSVEKIPEKILIDIASLTDFCYLISGEEEIKDVSSHILASFSSRKEKAEN